MLSKEFLMAADIEAKTPISIGPHQDFLKFLETIPEKYNQLPEWKKDNLKMSGMPNNQPEELSYLENILNPNAPIVNYWFVIDILTRINISDELLLKILNHEGNFNIEIKENFPSTRSPDGMIKFIAIQVLFKQSGLKYENEIIHVEPDFASVFRNMRKTNNSRDS